MAVRRAKRADERVADRAAYRVMMTRGKQGECVGSQDGERRERYVGLIP